MKPIFTSLNRTKRGSFYVFMVALCMIIGIILAYIALVQYFNEEGKTAIQEGIGNKQGAILQAVEAGEQIHLYSELALHTARDSALAQYACGSDYLGRKLVGTTTCTDTFADAVTQKFLERLAQYPEGSLTDVFGAVKEDKNHPGTLVVAGQRQIPIIGAALVAGAGPAGPSYTAAGGTFSGGTKAWPVDTSASPMINSYFGNRNLNGEGCIDHSGIDLSSGGKEGVPVSSLLAGDATFHPDGINSFIRVVTGEITVDYVHTRPVLPVQAGKTVPVTAGQEIGVTGPHPNPHLHLQVSVSRITPTSARQDWPGHVGKCNSKLDATTYAVVSSSEQRVYLNPLCFFDRTFIDSVPRGSVTKTDDPYEACNAYEQSFHLTSAIGPILSSSGTGATSAPTVAATTPTPTPTTTAPTPTTQPSGATPADLITQAPNPAMSSLPKVQRTYANLQKPPGYIDLINAEAKKAGIDPALLFGVITQESEGNPMLVSPTGPAGIGQFEAKVAKASFPPGSSITACCTTEEGDRRVCNDPAVRACPDTDSRFDPTIAIPVMAKVLADEQKRNAGLDQQVAFTLVGYNAGDGIARQVKARVSANPTWTEMRNILKDDITIKDANGPLSAKKRDEVIGYVEDITTKYIPAWGGSTIAGSGFTTERTGYYTLRLSLSIDGESKGARTIESIRKAITSCEDQQCVDDAIASAASANSATIVPEDLTSTTGCMPAEERAEAFVANQLEWCKRSPDDDCLCPLHAGIKAEVKLSPDYTQLVTLDGNAVTVDPMSGLAFDTTGETASLPTVKFYDNNNVIKETSDFTIKLMANGGKEVEYLLLNKAFSTLQKRDSDGGLSLTTSPTTPENSCILPESLKQQPFCVRAIDGSFPPLVFYLDRRLPTKPTVDVEEYRAQKIITNSAVRVEFFTDKQYPYAQVHYEKPGETTSRDDYFRITDSTNSIFDLLAPTFLTDLTDTFKARVRTIQRSTLPLPPLPPHETLKYLHDVIIHPQDGEQATLYLLDENLNPTDKIDITIPLTTDQSGITMPTSLLPTNPLGVTQAVTGIIAP